MANHFCGGYLGTPIASVAGAVITDLGTEGACINGLLIAPATTIALYEDSAAGALKFSYVNAGADSAWVPIPLKFKGSVYSSATGALIY